MYNNTNLEDLIVFLRTLLPSKSIRYGFGEPHSDRGSYEELAFTPVRNTTAGAMLKHAESANGQTFTGYKGGDYTMDKTTPVYIGEWGECGTALKNES